MAKEKKETNIPEEKVEKKKSGRKKVIDQEQEEVIKVEEIVTETTVKPEDTPIMQEMIEVTELLPEVIIVSNEHVTVSNNITEVEESPKEQQGVIGNLQGALEEVLVTTEEKSNAVKPVLSNLAFKWNEYIKYYKTTPEKFLEKYPNHKFKSFIEEIITYNKIQGEDNI